MGDSGISKTQVNGAGGNGAAAEGLSEGRQAVGLPERSEGTRSVPSRSGGSPTGEVRAPADPVEAPPPPDPEVPERPVRRHFTAGYKLGVLRAADAATKPGDIAALLRREGLYSSHLVTWRRQRDVGALGALAPKKRGPKAEPVNPLARRVAELEREKRGFERRLKQAELIIDFQKKVSEILGIPLKSPESDESDS